MSVLEIPLTRGLVALIDAADFDLVSERKWTAQRVARKGEPPRWFAVSREGDLSILMHRLLVGAGPGEVVGHEDGDGLRNLRSNLRVSDKTHSCLNAVKRKNSLSRFKGVSANRDLWVARFMNKRYGTFTTEEEAARAYDRAALAFSPEFARTNFLPDGSERCFDRESFEAPPKPLTSNYVGVHQEKRWGKWIAKHNGREIGRASTPEQAAAIYARAAGSEVLICRA
jgi:hypothetical protein